MGTLPLFLHLYGTRTAPKVWTKRMLVSHGLPRQAMKCDGPLHTCRANNSMTACHRVHFRKLIFPHTGQ